MSSKLHLPEWQRPCSFCKSHQRLFFSKRTLRSWTALSLPDCTSVWWDYQRRRTYMKSKQGRQLQLNLMHPSWGFASYSYDIYQPDRSFNIQEMWWCNQCWPMEDIRHDTDVRSSYSISSCLLNLWCIVDKSIRKIY